MGTYKRIYFIDGKYFGSDLNGKIKIVVKVLYGINSDSASFHKQKVRKIQGIVGIQEYQSKPDTWMKPAVNSKGLEHYENISTHVDDGMTIRNDCKNIIKYLWGY